ncbi:hypothetical protein MAMC_02045 [Methylacidimicrobium cyclopophantes]|uniref:Uncharacterized protein n=1 Tax=Methylacidimicrobium cyclopophantes TaxID=1041766 RepID=A0A5E6MIZ1_9BACT|nr:hypothetical protein [Methylacidimicrobium cyclopophantes]VVM08308.1 hypothetical protein MAMC_02045 [Methylacidimicrobium cyclopophantes]
MDASLLLLLYGALLFALRGVPSPPRPSGQLQIFLWHLVTSRWWPHGSLLSRDSRTNWVVLGWIAGSFLLGRASFFAPHSPLAYSLDQLGGLTAGLCLLSGFGLVALQLRDRAERVTDKKQEQAPPPRALVALREDEAILRLPGYSAQSIQRLASRLYRMPGEAVALLNKDRIVSVLPWPPEADSVEAALRALEERLAQTEERALALSMERNRASEALFALEGKLEELERARHRLVKDVARMRAESRLGNQSDFYRLSEAELTQAREVRQKEIALIEQILEVREKAGGAQADALA